jgi:hypothetical protein
LWLFTNINDAIKSRKIGRDLMGKMEEKEKAYINLAAKIKEGEIWLREA